MRSRGRLWVLATGMFVIGLDMFVVSPILPAIAAGLHSGAYTGLVVTAFALPYGALAPVFGPISDRHGRRTVLIFSLPVFALASVLTATAPSFTILLGARFLAGAAAGAFTPALYASAADLSPLNERPRAMATVMSGTTVGMVLGVPVGAAIAQWTSWRGTFWVVAFVATVVLTLLLWFVPTKRSGDTATGHLAAYVRALSKPGALPALLTSGLWYGFAVGTYTFVGSILKARYGLTVAESGLVLALFGIATGAGNFLAPLAVRLMRRPHRVVLLGVFGVGIGIALVTSINLPLALCTAFLVLWALAGGFGLPIQQSILASLGGELRGTLLSLGSGAMYLGLVVATALESWWIGTAGLTALGVLPSVALIGAAVASVAVGRRAST